MREIKFRAWNTKLRKMFFPEEMAQDQMCLLPTGYFINVHPIAKLSTIDYDYVMIPLQFTGLHDRLGKEIWEGDIVKFTSHAKYDLIGEVKWFDDVSSFMIEYKFSSTVTDWQEFGLPIKKIEIIGNVWENPELLKKE